MVMDLSYICYKSRMSPTTFIMWVLGYAKDGLEGALQMIDHICTLIHDKKKGYLIVVVQGPSS